MASEWAPGDVTPSGYPYIVKRLARGEPLSAAVEVYRGDKTDGGYGVAPAVLMDGQGIPHFWSTSQRPLDTFRHETWVLTAKGAEHLDIPAKADIQDLVGGRVLVRLDEAWSAGGQSFAPGSLVDLDLTAVKADPTNLHPHLVWAPSPRESLGEVSATRDKLIVTTLDNVRGRAFVYAPTADGGWSHHRLPLADNLSVGIADVDRRSNLAFLSASGFLDPNGLMLADAASGSLTLAKSLPAKFDASKDVVEQFEATSSDGTRIPYFVVHRRDIAYDGSTPTLMTAYGGFQVSNTPYYSAANGKLWLERGGAFVLANIRGGGEFGPAWHEAGLGVKRQIIYDDFQAVAQDLIARKITSARRLGIEGGSNGGLLMGVEFTQHPELYRAVVIDVPLLDMIRISKIAAGASWQGEYGDVNFLDPAVMAFWLKTSPYQNLRKTGVASSASRSSSPPPGRRPGGPATRPQVRRAHGGDGPAVLLLGEHRRRARRRRRSEAGGPHHGPDHILPDPDADGLRLARLSAEDAREASRVHRAAFDERLPWLSGLHTPDEDAGYWRDHVFAECQVWGAREGDQLVGVIAFREGFIEQFYILPAFQGVGARGRASA